MKFYLINNYITFLIIKKKKKVTLTYYPSF